MTTYNFNELIDRRNTDTIKWSKKQLREKFEGEDCIPMWIADMDFKAAEPIIQAIKERADHGIYGYGYRNDEFLDSAVHWQKKRNGWDIKQEWLLFTPGVVPALNFIVSAFCRPGDKVIVQSPVYYPFYKAIKNNGCHVVNNQLMIKSGRYEINFDELEELAKDSRTKMLILCSPHNPVGRVWTREELTKLGDICLNHGVLVVSDEIHSDLIYSPNQHIPFGKVSAEFKMNSIVCTAPSKTFNLAGLQASNIIVPNEKLRGELLHKLAVIDIAPNSFASVAQIAAYHHGDEWLDQLMIYLKGNLDYMEDFIKQRLPKVKMIRPEASYLAWLDFSEYGFTTEELQQIMRGKAKLALDDGFIFGVGGESFQRINFACPRSILEKAMEYMANNL